MQEDRSYMYGDVDFEMNDNQKSNLFVSYPDGNVSISQDYGAFNANSSNLSFPGHDDSVHEQHGQGIGAHQRIPNAVAG